MTTIDTDLRDRWIAALESGEYQQADGRLRRASLHGDGDAYCCLGVLCNLLDPNAWDATEDGFQVWGDEKSIFIPPVEALARVGLDEGIAGDLATRNDGGDTFREIAQILRSQEA